MKHKSMKVMTLAAALAVSMSASALAGQPAAGGGGGGGPKPGEVEANADTTISILTTASSQPNISYTVPLYVTMAVVSNSDTVQVPTNYILTNTTPQDNGADVPIGVTNMSFEKISDNGFKTVDSAAAATNADQIYLTIGGAKMPALDAKGTKQVPLAGSVFVNATEPTKPAALTGSTNLTIAGNVKNDVRTDQATAAQFRVKYTVSLLTAGGQALGAVYAGDDSTAAGLGEWNGTGFNPPTTN